MNIIKQYRIDVTSSDTLQKTNRTITKKFLRLDYEFKGNMRLGSLYQITGNVQQGLNSCCMTFFQRDINCREVEGC